MTNSEVMQWEQELPALQGIARLNMLTRLAWHQCQRDTPRALALADEACELIDSFPSPYFNQQSLDLTSARIQLTRAEAAWLYGDLALSEQTLRSTLEKMSALSGTEFSEICADAHYLLACIASQRGDVEAIESEILSASHFASDSGDLKRETVAQAFLANQTVLRDLPLAIQQWGERFSPIHETQHPVIASYINEFLIYTATLSSDFGHAAAYGIQVYEFALLYGQKQRAIKVANNIGDAFNSLNDHQAALQWMQAGHDLARETNWPNSIANCLVQMSETLRRLGRLDAAKKMLEEVLPILAKVPGSRTHMLALRYLGDLLLDQGEYEIALKSFASLKDWSDEKNQLDFRIGSRRGYAHVLSLLGQPTEALVAAHEVLVLAIDSKDSYRYVDVNRVLAAIHMRHALPAPEVMIALTAPLHYLRMALQTAEGICGYHIPGDLLEEIADAEVENGNYHEAFRFNRMAIAAREAIHNQEVTNRANAMEVSRQTERMRAESAHLRQLATAEAERAELLSQTSAILERLGAIGQEITASLDAAAVFEALNRHVHGLLHVTAFVIYLRDSDEQSMTSAFGVENGEKIEPDTILMSSTVSNSVRCVKECREILIDTSPDEEVPGLIPGTEKVLSMLFAPLTIGDRILGVMTIQSSKEHAYGDRERMIFRSLCAYGAIAMSNADAYLRLKQTQEHLLAQEKLAALGSLVAGVAHELNTPIGNCLLVASTLQDGTKGVIRKLEQQNLRRSELTHYCNEVQTSSDIMMRSLSSAATLVSSFKQVAVDRTSEHRREFDLMQMLQDIIATLNIRIGHAGHTLRMAVPANIHMDSYPGSLGQVITNLVENAILHAFESGKNGVMTLTAAQPDVKRVLIQFSDDGVGFPSKISNVFLILFSQRSLAREGVGLV